MQKTSRLVAQSRKFVLRILLMSGVSLALTAGSAFGQEASQDDTWGEKTPPKNYVRSKEPNTSGDAYNWKQMAAAGGVMAIMGLFVVVLIRRAKREDGAA